MRKVNFLQMTREKSASSLNVFQMGNGLFVENLCFSLGRLKFSVAEFMIFSLGVEDVLLKAKDSSLFFPFCSFTHASSCF